MNSNFSAPTSAESRPKFFDYVSLDTIQKVRARLWWHCGDQSWCFPSNEHLSKVLKLSVRTVKYCIQALKHFGEITVQCYKRSRTIHLLVVPNLAVPARGPAAPHLHGTCTSPAPHLPPNCSESLESPESKEEQQQASDSTQTSSSIHEEELVVVEKVTQTQEENPLVALLVEQGVTESVARQITQEHNHEEIAAQIEALPYRKVASPVGALLTSIRQAWSMPPGILNRQQKEQGVQALEEGNRLAIRSLWAGLPDWLKDSYRAAAKSKGCSLEEHLRGVLGFH